MDTVTTLVEKGENSIVVRDERFAVEVFADDGTWTEMPGFSSTDKGEALRGAAVIRDCPFPTRVVQVVVVTAVTETVVTE